MRQASILYVSGEESERQIKLRADRMLQQPVAGHEPLLYCESNIDKVLEYAATLKPKLLVIDSIQTMASEMVESSPGSVTQIRECT